MQHLLHLLLLRTREPVQPPRQDAVRDAAPEVVEEVCYFEYFSVGEFVSQGKHLGHTKGEMVTVIVEQVVPVS